MFFLDEGLCSWRGGNGLLGRIGRVMTVGGSWFVVCFHGGVADQVSGWVGGRGAWCVGGL